MERRAGARHLETTPIEVHSEAHGINNRGQAVGLGCCMGDILRALLCQNGNVYDLNELIPATSGWFLQEVDSINDRGEIVGYGTNPAGQVDAFLLHPLQGHRGHIPARNDTEGVARAHAAWATLPASVRRSLERNWPHGAESGAQT